MGEQYVGIDLHRRRSVIARMTPEGGVLECVRIDNDPVAMSLELAKAGPDPEVVLEATYGWYWAADLLQAEGANVHLVHPLGLHWDTRRVKNDERDATELAHRPRRDDLPEAWIAPPELRELRGARPLPGQAGVPAHLGQGPGTRSDGQGRDPARIRRHVRPRGPGPVGPDALRGRLCHPGGVPPRPARALRAGTGPGHPGAAPPPGRGPGLCRHPGHPPRGADHGR